MGSASGAAAGVGTSRFGSGVGGLTSWTSATLSARGLDSGLAGCLAVVSPLVICDSSLAEMTSTATDSCTSSNFLVSLKATSVATSIAACATPETIRPGCDQSTFTGRPSVYFFGSGSVTSATFLYPAALITDITSATRP